MKPHCIRGKMLFFEAVPFTHLANDFQFHCRLSAPAQRIIFCMGKHGCDLTFINNNCSFYYLYFVTLPERVAQRNGKFCNESGRNGTFCCTGARPKKNVFRFSQSSYEDFPHWLMSLILISCSVIR